MKTSSKGLALIKSFEGCLKPIGGGMFKPYICPAGVLTIGWGHTNHHGRPFDQSTRWTQAECDAVLAEDLAGFERSVARLVKVPLNQGQFDALVSFAYNCGEGNLSKSTLLRRLNTGDFEGTEREFSKWTKGGGKVLQGLVRRRTAEAQLFASEPVSAPMPGPMPQQVDPPDDDDMPVEQRPQPDDPGPKHETPEPDEPPARAPWWKRLWLRWTGGTVGTYLGLSAFSDWQIAAVMISGAFMIGALSVGAVALFIGPEGRAVVRGWIVRQFRA